MSIRDQFSIFKNKPNLVYLDSASSTQKPDYVVQKTSEYIHNSYANLWRGSYILADESDYFYYGCKEKIADLVHCKANEIFFSYNATYCINSFATAIAEAGILSSWKQIILSVIEHHANILIRQKLAKTHNCSILRLGLTKDGELDIDSLKGMVHGDTAVVSLSLCSNVLWIKNNLNTVREIIGNNCIFCVDASQAVPNYQIDIDTLWCDFCCFSAHKFLSYTWLGIGYIKKSLQKTLKAQVLGGGVIEEVSQSSYQLKSSIEQFEAGTPNIISIVSLYYAIERWENYGGYEEWRKQEKTLIDYLDNEFSKRSSQYNILNNKKNSIGIRTFTSTKHSVQKISEHLYKHDICIRSGGHCAHPLHNYLWIHNWSLRLSLYIYNNKEDIERFFSAMDWLK